MREKISRLIKPLLKNLLVVGLIVTLVFSQASDALAARSGGRIGGGSFSAPRSSYTRPAPSYGSRGGGYYPGGFGFPFIFPFFGFGGGFGGLFTVILFIGLANFLVRSFRNATAGDEYGYGGGSAIASKVSVARLQLGLLADARELQADLNRVAKTANTGSSEGLTQVLQEATLSMLRHPEYWIYGDSTSTQAKLDSAEAEFNRLALIERSKFSDEAVSNVNNQIKQASDSSSLTKADQQTAIVEAPGEYIVATVIVATQGKLELPKINNSDDLRRALSQIGSVSSDDLMALEILWTPQAEGETLSSDELLTGYPNLRLV